MAPQQKGEKSKERLSRLLVYQLSVVALILHFAVNVFMNEIKAQLGISLTYKLSVNAPCISSSLTNIL